MTSNKKRPSLEDFKREARKDKNYIKEYEKLELEFNLIEQLIIARKRAKLSQKELADKLKTKQPSVARFENGGYQKVSIAKLQEYVNALGYDLDIHLVPIGDKGSSSLSGSSANR